MWLVGSHGHGEPSWPLTLFSSYHLWHSKKYNIWWTPCRWIKSLLYPFRPLKYSLERGGATCQNLGQKECLSRGWEILYLELSSLHDFFQTMLTIQYTSGLFKKIRTFSTFRSPIGVDNRNLEVPDKRVCHQSQLNILYIFYAYFFTRNQLRLVPDMSDPSRTPSSTSTPMGDLKVEKVRIF